MNDDTRIKAARDVLAAARGGALHGSFPVEPNPAQLAAAAAYRAERGFSSGEPEPGDVEAWNRAAKTVLALRLDDERETDVMAREACRRFYEWREMPLPTTGGLGDRGRRAWTAFALAVLAGQPAAVGPAVRECAHGPPYPPPAHTIDTVARARWRPMPIQYRYHDPRGLTLTFERYRGRSSSNGGQ